MSFIFLCYTNTLTYLLAYLLAPRPALRTYVRTDTLRRLIYRDGLYRDGPVDVFVRWHDRSTEAEVRRCRPKRHPDPPRSLHVDNVDRLNYSCPPRHASTSSFHCSARSRRTAEAKCIVVTAVCVSVCLSLAAFPHCCMDPDVSWGNGRG